MRIGPLTLLVGTTSPTVFNIASWHWRSSLTWSWVLSFRRHDVAAPRPWVCRNPKAFGAGVGTAFGFSTYRVFDGRQWSVFLLWCSINWHRQRPMFLVDDALGGLNALQAQQIHTHSQPSRNQAARTVSRSKQGVM